MFTCTCTADWSGTTCATRVDKCVTANPCLNGAQCTNGNTAAAPTCVCAAGYTGATCATYQAVCNPNPCQNQGQCAASADGTTAVCTCNGNYTGNVCQTLVDHCAGQTCNNGGVCSPNYAVNPPSFTCACDPGYNGVNCVNSKLFYRLLLKLEYRLYHISISFQLLYNLIHFILRILHMYSRWYLCWSTLLLQVHFLYNS